MKCSAAVSEEVDARRAAGDVCRSVQTALGGAPPDLAILLLGKHHAGDAAGVLDFVHQNLAPRHVLGVTSAGIIAGGRELEQRPAMALWGASFPNVQVRSLRFACDDDDEASGDDPVEIESLSESGSLIVFADPFSFPAVEFLDLVAAAHPDTAVLGGMASSGRRPGENRLFCDDRVVDNGAVAVTLHGDIATRSVVSQGCRPFGRPMVVTRSEGRVVHELGGRPALDRLREEASRLGQRDRRLLANGLHVGKAIDAARVRGEQGDFVVRNVTGVFDDVGALAVSDEIRPGQTVRFHLEDPDAASAELVTLLRDAAEELGDTASGGLLFACGGRGTRMFQRADHDAGLVASRFDGMPLAGFFAAGEIGPIGTRSFLHGFAAVLALFAPPRTSTYQSARGARRSGP